MVATAAAIAICLPLEKTNDTEFIILKLNRYFFVQLKTVAQESEKEEEFKYS
jgi:hypothetical protein